MWIPKGVALIKGRRLFEVRRLFEARRLLEEIRQIEFRWVYTRNTINVVFH